MNNSTLSLSVILISFIFPFTNASDLEAAEKIVVTYKDGKKEDAELVSYDRETLVLRLKVGSNKLDMKVPWLKVEELSNGLTHALVMKKWWEKNKDKLCGDCEGKGITNCAACDGKGKAAKGLIPCKTCKGTGEQNCQEKGCEKGKADCPEPCLKLSQGEWVKGDLDLRWRKFPFTGGARFYSERNCGDVIKYKDGKPLNLGKCKNCGGTTKIDCTTCEGDGIAPCADCLGKKKVKAPGSAEACMFCKAGKITCPTCKGKGLKL